MPRAIVGGNAIGSNFITTGLATSNHLACLCSGNGNYSSGESETFTHISDPVYGRSITVWKTISDVITQARPGTDYTAEIVSATETKFTSHIGGGPIHLIFNIIICY
jgi:hypothetical protein